MNDNPITIEKTLEAPREHVWQALTVAEEMQQWYFPIKEFKAEPGFEFQFSAGPEGRQYLHKCKVTEVIPPKKLSYTWRYEGLPGNSLVTFELLAQGNDTRVILIQEGVNSFHSDHPDFAKTSFIEGWHHIIGVSLKEYVEAKFIAKTEVNIHAPAEKVWQALTDPDLISEYMFGARVDSDWKPGSPITFRGEYEGRTFLDKGEILKLEPNRLLKYTHYSPLSGLPDSPENYHTVTIELHNGGADTQVSLSQDNNHDKKEQEHSRKNWDTMMQGLKKVVERSVP